MAGSFSADISKFITKTGSNIDKALRQTVALVAQELDHRTPRLTGRLVGNWQFGKQSIPTGILERLESAAGTTHKRLMQESANVKAGGVCWIVNNLPYAGEIEYGHSRVKAPAGMVRITLAGLPAAIEDYVRGLQ